MILQAVALWLAARAAATTPALPVRPACGVTGYVLSLEYRFGTGGNVRNLADLERLFTHDAPWGRINGELESFPPFNARTHVFEADALALTGRHDSSTDYAHFGHIVSGALLSRATVTAPCLVEFLARQPAGRGVWPSLWLYDTHSGRHDASEIDVLESQNDPPRNDRSMVYQNDHGPGAGEVLENPGGLNRWGAWQPYGPMPDGDLSRRFAAYAVLWERDRVTKFVDDRRGVTRAFRWTGPAAANLLVYNSIGSETIDWTGPVSAETFTGGRAVFRIRTIRVFTPAP